MKFKTTKKYINNGYDKKIKVGYCQLQSLLDFEKPKAYGSNCYGWAFDVYEINDSTTIIMGYAPFGNISPSYDLIKKYETKAEKIKYNYNLSYEVKVRKLKKLLLEFVEKAIEESGVK